MPANLLHPLDDTPVCGVSMGNVSLLRLDLTGGMAPGNKAFKLQENLAAARSLGVRRLVSFGGAWSNHLHALAALGCEQGYETVGIVRGESAAHESAMLTDARAWGMQVHRVSRAHYRRRNDPVYLDQLQRQFAPCLVIPEGGANAAGAHGCMAIAELVRQFAPGVERVVLPVGTGTTLAGLAAGLGEAYELVGIAALKGASDCEQRVCLALGGRPQEQPARWRVLHHDHCGGFARTTQALRAFIHDFENIHGIPLEPVYTGKMLFAIHRHLESGLWDPGTPLLAIHTGGLQGRRGFPWLSPI